MRRIDTNHGDDTVGRSRWRANALLLLALGMLAIAGRGGGASGGFEGRVEIDGSSTVAPLTTLAAEEFTIVNPRARITVGISGTGGGFERFCNGETDLSDASRAIRDEEAEACAAEGIEFIEFAVATDALTVVVNPDNDWVDCLTVEQLGAIWPPESESTVGSWADVDPGFPDEAPTRAPSTTSQMSSTAPRARAAPTTHRPRTTMSSSRRSRARKAAPATSGSRISSRTPTR